MEREQPIYQDNENEHWGNQGSNSKPNLPMYNQKVSTGVISVEEQPMVEEVVVEVVRTSEIPEQRQSMPTVKLETAETPESSNIE